MSKVFDLPRSFVPRLLRNYINTRLLNGEESLKAASFFFQGACLIVDISGFTALSEGFCDAGKLGIDGLQVCTNGYIGDLVAIVQSHGGDIVKFAGDALICVFCDEKFSPTSRSRKREDVDVDVLLRAMVCAKEVCGVRTDRLTVHVGMSCGEMCFGILGGVENRWECLISGPCIYELSQCLDDAPSMQAVMTAQCVEGIQGHTKTQDTVDSDAFSTACTYTLDRPLLQYTIRLETLPSSNRRLNEVTTSTRPQLGGMKKQVSFGGNVDTNAVKLSERLKALSDALIRQFVPAPILEELNGATGLSYFAEIREVVTMFMKV
jgi:class 3 adenylate cyclase